MKQTQADRKTASVANFHEGSTDTETMTEFIARMNTAEYQLESIRKHLQRGDTIYCILRKRSRSGSSRTIQFIQFKDDQPIFLSFAIAKIFGYRYDEKCNGVVIRGSGMDFGQDAVMNLASKLFSPYKYDREASNAIRTRWI